MKVLVTGSGGFLGKYVLTELKENNQGLSPVLLTSKTNNSYPIIGSKKYSFDINYLSENGCDDVECLIHMGAFTPKSSSQANDIDGCTSNITGTKALISSILPSLKKIIYLSTLDVYEETCNPISEKTPCNPSTLYGLSKLYCEKMIASFCKKKDITYQILRIGHVYGPGEEAYRKVMPVIIEKALKNLPISIYGDGNIKRTYIYVEDVAKAIVRSLSLSYSDTINIVGDTPISINSLATLIIQLAESSSEIQHVAGSTSDHNILFDPSHMKEYLFSNLTPLDTGLLREINYIKERM